MIELLNKKSALLFVGGIIKTKLGQDILWNYLSLMVLAVSGILINIIIAGIYGASTLGVFNQVYAVYIMASQFAVCGIQFSVLKHVSQFAEERDRLNQIVSSGVGISLFMGIIISAVTFYLSKPIGALLSSPEVVKGIPLIAPALIFFPLNKVLLAVLNGLRHMKAFAFIQALRYILLISFVVVLSLFGLPGYTVVITFIGSEVVLFFSLLLFVWPHVSFIHWSKWDNWFMTHIIFGVKGFASGVLLEINSRVDILMLGFFLADKAVGIYSFAAMLAEGIYQILIIIRNNINPILVRLIADNAFDKIKSLVSKTQRILYPLMTMLVLIVVGLFPFCIRLLYGDGDFMQSWPVLIILSGGILIYSGYIPFNNIMIQAGLPGYHTIMTLMVVISNIVLNAIMIPIWGTKGAAFATSISYMLAIVYLIFFAEKKLNLNLR